MIMDYVYELFGTDKRGFFDGLMDAFKKLYNFLLPFLLSAKFDELFGTKE